MRQQDKLSFTACGDARPWRGRYARIPGTETVFHVRSKGSMGWTICLDWGTSEGIAECIAVQSSEAAPEIACLVSAVNRVKVRQTGHNGGCFSINEWGQVLVPSAEVSGTRCFLVGTVTGTLLFENPLNRNTPLDLSHVDGLRPGDRWNRPLVGLPYHLKAHSDSIYFWRETEGGGRTELPIQQDSSLIRTLRQIRGSHRPVRLLVNPWGVVLTKTPAPGMSYESAWQSVYVGKLDYSRWFSKEEA
jgi:hypothetical protein